MPRGPKLTDRGKQPQKKGVMTNEEKAENFTRALSEQMVSRIQNGEVQIGKKEKIAQKIVKKEHLSPAVYLESIEESLKSLRASIKEQKEETRQFEKMKLVKAHELVAKMKRQKEEHKRKLLETEEKSLLHSRIFSESSLAKMRSRLEERVKSKKKEIEERVRSIAARKSERDQKMVHQQIQYWEKIKKVTDNSKSSNHLPSLFNPETEVKRKSVGNIPRRSSFDIEVKTEPYSKKIDLFLEQVKSKERHLNLKQVEKKNQERLNKMIINNQRLVNDLSDSNANNEFLPLSISNKSKIFGDEYLKASLLKIKKREVSKQEVDSVTIHQSLELKAREVPIHQSEIVSKMREKWDRVLSRIKHSEIEQQKGLELLNSLQRKLDKIDKEGIANRLKSKIKLFDRGQPVNKISLSKDEVQPPTPSFEGKS